MEGSISSTFNGSRERWFFTPRVIFDNVIVDKIRANHPELEEKGLRIKLATRYARGEPPVNGDRWSNYKIKEHSATDLLVFAFDSGNKGAKGYVVCGIVVFARWYATMNQSDRCFYECIHSPCYAVYCDVDLMLATPEIEARDNEKIGQLLKKLYEKLLGSSRNAEFIDLNASVPKVKFSHHFLYRFLDTSVFPDNGHIKRFHSSVVIPELQKLSETDPTYEIFFVNMLGVEVVEAFKDIPAGKRCLAYSADGLNVVLKIGGKPVKVPQKCVKLTPERNKRDCVIDLAPYGHNQCFRLIASCKRGKQNHLKDAALHDDFGSTKFLDQSCVPLKWITDFAHRLIQVQHRNNTGDGSVARPLTYNDVIPRVNFTLARTKRPRTDVVESSSGVKEICYSNQLEFYEQLLDILPNEYCENRDSWMRVAFIGHHTAMETGMVPGDYFDVWNEWSKRSSSYTSDGAIQLWESISQSPANSVSIGTLMYWIQDAGIKVRMIQRYSEEEISKSVINCETDLSFISEIVQRSQTQLQEQLLADPPQSESPYKQEFLEWCRGNNVLLKPTLSVVQIEVRRLIQHQCIGVISELKFMQLKRADYAVLFIDNKLQGAAVVTQEWLNRWFCLPKDSGFLGARLKCSAMAFQFSIFPRMTPLIWN
eukprot:TRINITY_DN2722_c0_g1_i1.p1 TRINITY_DN2722_c0_g1~~TRINITY_DN2722_c0_g1_i1.p1  ORF type:complete len:651 (-),score=52.56 TRINITY_DN2722_c0_g1_i1:2690-4642(-)